MRSTLVRIAVGLVVSSPVIALVLGLRWLIERYDVTLNVLFYAAASAALTLACWIVGDLALHWWRWRRDGW